MVLGRLLSDGLGAPKLCADGFGLRAYILLRARPLRMRQHHSCHSLNDRLRNRHHFQFFH